MYYFSIFLSLTILGCGLTPSVLSQDIKTVRDLQVEYAKKYPFGTITSRIIEGNNAAECQFPWQIRLIGYTGADPQYSCGGSIIAICWVLTAGHCYQADEFLRGRTSYLIEAGSVTSGQPRQSHTVTNQDAFLHPMYDEVTLENDITLLRTPNFDFSSCNVQPISIISDNWTPAFYLGEIITISGFGLTSNDGEVARHLQWTELTVISREECRANYNAIPLSCLCAQDEDQNPEVTAICSGDSGGPAMITLNGKLVQIGVVSFGSSNGCDTAPQGFANLALHHCWIYETMQSH